MTDQQTTGWGIVLLILFLLWYLGKYGLNFLHGTMADQTQTTVVQSGIALPGGQQNMPTVTTYPPSACCS